MTDGGRDFEARMAEAWATKTCAQCGTDLDPLTLLRSVFCSSPCSIRFGDRRRYHANVEAGRARARDYYHRNREKVLAAQAARRAAGEIGTMVPRHCSECGTELKGRHRVTCGSRRCRDARFKHTNPEAYAERERQKVERRREARRAKREGSTT